MKELYWLLALTLSGSIAAAQPSGKTVKVVGIVGLDINSAILEVTQTNHARTHTDQFMLGTNETQSGVQVENIDVTKGIVTANVDGKARTLAFSGPDTAATDKPSAIRLSDVRLQCVINLYGELKGRTVLQHPGLRDTGFTLSANPQSRSEAAKALEELFARHQIAAIPDGEKFVMLVPIAITNRVSPHSDKFAGAGPMIQAASVNFQNVPLDKVLEVYGELTGHSVNNLQNSPYAPIYFVQENSLSKNQICYGLETLFAWNGIQLTTNQDNTVNWERIQ
jgi:hypothetical protein